jgi:phosphoribosylglycinamide formyltransferase 2
VEGDSNQVAFGNLHQALVATDTQLRLFGKPEVHGERRMGVGLALGENIAKAREKALGVAQTVEITL